MYTIGVDLGGTYIDVGVVDEDHRIVGRARTLKKPERGMIPVFVDIGGCVNMALHEAATDISECRGMGVGSPGTCDSRGGMVVQAYNLGWFEVPLSRMLSERFGLPVYLGNDGDCAALGEAVAGAAKGSDSALMVILRTGVGGGMVINGRIFAGHRTLGGEIGHMCIQRGGARCSCGKDGCWETYASTTALIRQAEKAARDHPESALLSMFPLDGEKIFAAKMGGDALAREIVERYCEYVGIGLVNLINILFPEVVLMGGGICNAGDALLDPIRAYVQANCFVKKENLLPRIIQASLGDDAGIIGAAALCG